MKRLFALALAWVSVAAFAQITYTDYSGSIATGGTSQTLAPASNGRVRIAILNPATESENLCVNLTTAASCTPGSSWILQSGQSIVIDSTEAVTVVAATTGHKWIAKAGVGPGFAANGGGSGGSVGSAATIADGADVNSGATTDAAATAGGTGTMSAKLRLMTSQLATLAGSNAQLPTALGQTTASGSLSVVQASDATPTVAQGSTTSGQKGNLTQGAVTTAAPSYTTGQTSPLSLNTAGSLRVTDTSNPIGQTTGSSSVSTVPASDGGFNASVSLTRTADTNAYAANDVIGAATGSTAALTFSSMCSGSSGRVIITSASLEVDSSAAISGETSYRLHLYNVTPPSALGDNAAFDLPSGDRASYLGFINLGTPATLGSTLYVGSDGINKQIRCAGSSIYGYLVTIGAYTPTSARVYVINLHGVQP